MILGADTQNKELREAGSKRIDTSGRTETSNGYAAKIASSKNSTVGSADSGFTGVEHSKDSTKSDPVKGSFEGYMGGSSTHIQMNNSGYLNPSLQTARNNKEFVNQDMAKQFSGSTKSPGYSIMDNYSGSYAEKSSAQIVNQINKRNNLS